MVRARNMEIEDRARAVVELAELTVRDQQPDPGNPHCGWDTMAECHTLLASDLAVSREQAISNAWPASWRDAVDKAHSIRCVPINAHTKDPKRIQMFKCDVCGAKEKWCGLAIDLAGGRERPDRWYDPAKLKRQWLEHSTRYAADLVAEHDADGLVPCDLGRFYPGATCYRRTVLRYIANTMLPEVCHRAWMLCSEFTEDEMETEELQYADEGGAQELLSLKEQLELCIANDQRQDLPDPMSEDMRLWDAVDEARGGVGEQGVRSRASRTLNRDEDGDGGGGLDGLEEDDGSDTTEGSDEEEREDHAVPPKKRSRGPKDGRRVSAKPSAAARKRRHCVVHTDDEGEDGDEDEVRELSGSDSGGDAEVPRAQPPTRRKAAGPRPETAPKPKARGAPPSRRSSRVAGLEPGQPPPLTVAAPTAANGSQGFSTVSAAVQEEEEEEEEEEETGTAREPEDLADVRRARPPRPESRAPTAVRAATAARINGNLPSGHDIVLAASRLLTKLLAEERRDDAAVMSAVVMELQNLQAKVERARGTQGALR